VLNQANRPGVAALAHVARVKPGDITAETIGYALGPRINAAGRMAHAYKAAKLLAEPDMLNAARYAQELDRLNRERQTITRDLCAQAETMIDADSYLLMAAGDIFPSGIVGLVAGRLAEKFYRPAIVIEQGAEESRGSCRSIAEFHITHALDEVGDLLKRYGGHAQAAGFTIANENLPEFQERMQAITIRELVDQELKPAIEIDAEISFSLIDWALHGQLQQLEPTGEMNPTPVFVSRNLRVNTFRPVGKTGDHLKLTVGDGFHELEAIAFSQGAWSRQMPRYVDLVYTIDMNEWRGQRSLQLKVLDIQPSITSSA
jgi:single-stranded-DNA-specific exonuclease